MPIRLVLICYNGNASHNRCLNQAWEKSSAHYSIFDILTFYISTYFPLNIYWLSLLLAGCLEIGWPLGLKLADLPNMKIWGIVLALISMTLSGLLLWFSLKEIPIGTAYAVWTSIGAVGTFTIGVLVFGDPNIPLRWLGVAFILLGVILLKMG